MAPLIDILILDDEIEICEILSEVLKTEGYSTAIAHCGLDAISIAKANPPAIILCDITMPKMTGLETLEEMQKLGIPSAFVMLTAHSEKERIIQALQLGALDYVTKPFDPKLLIDRAAEWVEMGRRLQAIHSENRLSPGKSIIEKLRMIELFRIKNAQKVNKIT